MKTPALFLLAAAQAAAFAQSSGLPAAQRGGTFHEPPAQVDPRYVPAGPNRVAASEGEPPLTLRLALELPLDRKQAGGGAAPQASPRGSATLQAELRWRPLQDSHWFALVRFYRYLDGDRQRAWDPDFAYSFGYESWQPGTFSLVYANHTGTRLRDAAFRFPEGLWSAGYKFELPPALQRVFLTGAGDSALCRTDVHLMPRYATPAGTGPARHKRFLSAGCRYTAGQGWFGQATLYAYPRGGQQQPWDPDFSYGFGYRRDLGPGRWASAEYANYSGNRWPGRERAPAEGSWRNGSVLLSWATTW